MGVVKRKRKESRFEVIYHFYKLRKEITELLLRDFGYCGKKAAYKVEKSFGGVSRERLSQDEKDRYDFIVERNEAFDNWFIAHQRDVIMGCITSATEQIFQANSIYPSLPEELVERRIYQSKAIGQCYRMLQELQYTIEILPVNLKKYTRFIEMINKEIKLLKAWRKADNRFKKNFK